MSTPPESTPGFVQCTHPSAHQIARWLRDKVLSGETKRGDCYKLVIRHYSLGKLQGDVGKIDIPSSFRDDGTSIERIIQDVCDMAQEDADSQQSGVQTYGVFAYYTSDRGYSPKRLFRVAAQESVDPSNEGADPSEPASNSGLLAQLMRHNEASARISTAQSGYLIQTLMEDNRSQRKLIEAMLGQAMDVAALMQESLDNATSRRIEEQKAQTTQQMTETIFEHVKLLIPIILNKLTGQKIAPETDTSFAMLAALFESMPADQQQRFFTEFLSPAQAALFAEFLDTYEKRKKTLTSGDVPVKLNLPVLFDNNKDRIKSSETSTDPQINKMEKHARSFRDVFKRFSNKDAPPET